MRQNININMVGNSSQLYSAAIDNGQYSEIFDHFDYVLSIYRYI